VPSKHKRMWANGKAPGRVTLRARAESLEHQQAVAAELSWTFRLISQDFTGFEGDKRKSKEKENSQPYGETQPKYDNYVLEEQPKESMDEWAQQAFKMNYWLHTLHL